MSTTGPVRMFRVHVVLREMTGGTLALLLCALVFSTDRPMSPWNLDALVSLQGDLKLRVLMSTGLSDKLQKAAGGFMSEAEEQQVRNQHGDNEQMGKLLEILKGKQDKDFVIFLEMLRSANYGGWADELERKAEEFKKVKSELFSQFVLCVGKTLEYTSTLCIFLGYNMLITGNREVKINVNAER